MNEALRESASAAVRAIRDALAGDLDTAGVLPALRRLRDRVQRQAFWYGAYDESGVDWEQRVHGIIRAIERARDWWRDWRSVERALEAALDELRPLTAAVREEEEVTA